MSTSDTKKKQRTARGGSAREAQLKQQEQYVAAFDPACIDVEQSSKLSRSFLQKEFYLSFRDSWRKVYFERLRHWIHQKPVRQTDQETEYYASEDDYLTLRMNFTSTMPCLFPFLEGMAYLTTRLDTTFHEILFGMPKAPRLTVKTEQFLALLECLSDVDLMEIELLLRTGTEYTDSPMYVLWTRCWEQALDRDMELSQFMVLAPTQSCRVFCSRFSENTLFPVDYWNNRLNLDAFSSSLLSILLLTCMVHDLSLDYLLMRDYSPIAVKRNGEPLTEEQQRRLSLFLHATPAARDLALQEAILRITANGSIRFPLDNLAL